ncbi:hypothetical protein [Dehalogenimonas formicexedens]|uniref:hypothetical protein n=1 Tax=Dehalogenimonas formicexedens TaxID=1839801 RepID=UPI0011AB4162|nr:hypothetical protein [Dehalogenimonas formicexedens]
MTEPRRLFKSILDYLFGGCGACGHGGRSGYAGELEETGSCSESYTGLALNNGSGQDGRDERANQAVTEYGAAERVNQPAQGAYGIVAKG